MHRESSDEWSGDQYVAQALGDPKTVARRASLGTTDFAARSSLADRFGRLNELIAGDDPVLQLEAVRTLRDSPHAERGEILSQIAASLAIPACPAGRSHRRLDPRGSRRAPQVLLSLSLGQERLLRNEALRSLRGGTFTSAERSSLERIGQTDPESAELVQRRASSRRRGCSAGRRRYRRSG